MRKKKIIITVDSNKRVKIYANKRWQRYVTSIEFLARADSENGIQISCDIEKYKRNKNDTGYLLNDDRTEILKTTEHIRINAK